MAKNTKTTGIIKIKEDTRIKIEFPFNADTLDKVRTLTGRTWHSTNKFWSAALTLENIKLLESWGFLVDAVHTYIKDNTVEDTSNNIEIPKKLIGVIKPYQIEGVKLIEYFKGCALLADEMGLGKTLQALVWIMIHKNVRPVIVVCPSFLKINWELEVLKWMGKQNVQTIYGFRKEDTNYTGDIIIINYNILGNLQIQKTNSKGELLFDKKDKPIMIDIPYSGHVDFLKDLNPQILIMDEIHFINNKKTLRASAVDRLSENIPHKIGISGTPIEKRTFDIYNGVRIINKNIFISEWVFKNRYCAPKSNGFAMTYDGATNTKELHAILVQNVMIRRKKKDVLTELPDKEYSFVSLEMDNEKEYNEAMNDFINYIKKGVEINLRKELRKYFTEDSPIEINDYKLKKLQDEKVKTSNALTHFEILKQLAVKGKFKALIEWIENFLESGEKLVLFCEHVQTVEDIANYFKKVSVYIHGGVSTANRNKAVESFQNDGRIKLFVGNKGAEVGLTLTASSNIGIVEYPWNPGPLSQRIDRVHRITQLKKVMVFNFTALNTVEEVIAKMLHKKQGNIDKVLDGEIQEDTSLLYDLVNHYKNK